MRYLTTYEISEQTVSRLQEADPTYQWRRVSLITGEDVLCRNGGYFMLRSLDYSPCPTFETLHTDDAQRGDAKQTGVGKHGMTSLPLYRLIEPSSITCRARDCRLSISFWAFQWLEPSGVGMACSGAIGVFPPQTPLVWFLRALRY